MDENLLYTAKDAYDKSMYYKNKKNKMDQIFLIGDKILTAIRLGYTYIIIPKQAVSEEVLNLILNKGYKIQEINTDINIDIAIDLVISWSIDEYIEDSININEEDIDYD